MDILTFLLGTSLGFSLGALGAWWLSRHPEAPTLLDSTRARAAEIAKRAHELLALLKIRAHELPALLKIRVHELDALLERSMGERTSSAALVSKNLLVGALVLGTWYGLATGRLVADRESYGSLQLVQQLQEQSGRTVTYAETFDTDVFERRRVTLLDETFDEPLTGVLTLSEGSPEGLSRMRWPNGLLQSNADASTGPVSGRLAYYQDGNSSNTRIGQGNLEITFAEPGYPGVALVVKNLALGQQHHVALQSRQSGKAGFLGLKDADWNQLAGRKLEVTGDAIERSTLEFTTPSSSDRPVILLLQPYEPTPAGGGLVAERITVSTVESPTDRYWARYDGADSTAAYVSEGALHLDFHETAWRGAAFHLTRYEPGQVYELEATLSQTGRDAVMIVRNMTNGQELGVERLDARASGDVQPVTIGFRAPQRDGQRVAIIFLPYQPTDPGGKMRIAENRLDAPFREPLKHACRRIYRPDAPPPPLKQQA